MNNENNFEQWFKLNKNLSAPFGEMNKATTDMFKRLSEQNLECVEENIARYTEQLKRLSHVKSPEEWWNLQRECLMENMQAGIETSQKWLQLNRENMEELSSLYSNTAAKVSEKVVEKARKFAEKTEK